MKQRAEITFEIEETVVVRLCETRSTEFCLFCGTTVEMLTPQLAAAASDRPVREIFRQIEAGSLHFRETSEILICLKSLDRIYEKEKL